MSKNGALRRKIAKKKAAAAALNFDNAKPHQMASLLAERAKLIAAAEKRLPKGQAALLRSRTDEGRD